MPEDDIDRLSDPFGVLGDVFGGADEFASDPDDANAELPLPIDADAPALTRRPDPPDGDPGDEKSERPNDREIIHPALAAARHSEAGPPVKSNSLAGPGLFLLFLIAVGAAVAAC